MFVHVGEEVKSDECVECESSHNRVYTNAVSSPFGATEEKFQLD